VSRYIVMIYGDEQVWESWSEEQAAANGAAHRAFNDEHASSVVSGHELDRSWRGRSVRADADGRPTTSEGAFLGGPTVVGGCYVIEATDLDDAVLIAGDLLEASAPSGGVEVRPLVAPDET
jgi:hypothetical protein